MEKSKRTSRRLVPLLSDMSRSLLVERKGADGLLIEVMQSIAVLKAKKKRYFRASSSSSSSAWL